MDPYADVYARFECEPGSTYKFLDVELAASHDEVVCEKVVVAIPREPIDFVQRAVSVGHPRSVALQLPPDLQKVMEWNRDAKATEIFQHRIDFVKQWTSRAKELVPKDAELLAQAPPHLQSLLRNKRLAL